MIQMLSIRNPHTGYELRQGVDEVTCKEFWAIHRPDAPWPLDTAWKATSTRRIALRWASAIEDGKVATDGVYDLPMVNA